MQCKDLTGTDWGDGWICPVTAHQSVASRSRSVFTIARMGWLGRPVTILSVADARGGVEDPRGAVGAALACVCVQSAAYPFIGLQGTGRCEGDSEAAFNEFLLRIHAHWQEQVTRDLNRRSRQKQESDGDRCARRSEVPAPVASTSAIPAAATGGSPVDGESRLRPYEVSLRFAIVEPDRLWLAAIGSGAMAYWTEGTCKVHDLVSDPDRGALMTGDSVDAWWYLQLPRGEDMATLLMTDGASLSLSEAERYERVKRVLELARAKGAEGMQDEMPGLIAQWANDSGKEAALAIWADLKSVANLTDTGVSASSDASSSGEGETDASGDAERDDRVDHQDDRQPDNGG